MSLVSDYIKEFVFDLTYALTIKPRLLLLRKHFSDAFIFPAGSRYVCSPPVFGTDIDFLVLNEASIDKKLLSLGFVKTEWKDYSGSGVDERPISTWRKRSVNLIVTPSQEYAETFHTATHICKKYNLRAKYHRVLVHESLRGEHDVEALRLAILHKTFPEGIRFPVEVANLLDVFRSDYGKALQKAYRAQQGLEEIRYVNSD